MKLSIIFSIFFLLFATACTNSVELEKPKIHNPDSKKYYINHNGCLKKKTLWSQLGV